MIVNKAEIKQQLIVDDKTLDRLEGVEGDVHISINNYGSVGARQHGGLDLEAVLEQLYNQRVGFKEVVSIVKRIYLSFALRDYSNRTHAARRLKITRRVVDYYIQDAKFQIQEQIDEADIQKTEDEPT
jgi:hypothetical protein